MELKAQIRFPPKRADFFQCQFKKNNDSLLVITLPNLKEDIL
jgi:hypothetical protein